MCAARVGGVAREVGREIARRAEEVAGGAAVGGEETNPAE